MSGGAYDYLFCRDELYLVNDASNVESMIEDAVRAGVNEEAIAALKTFLGNIKKLAEEKKKLEDLLHAAEWYASGDYGDETFRESADEYRARGDFK